MLISNHIKRLEQLRDQFRSMGDNYVSLNNDGQVNKTTNTGAGRFFERIVTTLSSSARAENQRTVDALMAQLQSVPVLGAKLAQSFSEELGASATQGKPLSGWTIASALSRSIFCTYPANRFDAYEPMFIMDNVEYDGYLHKLVDTLNLPDPRDRIISQTNEVTGMSMSGTAATLLASLELEVLSHLRVDCYGPKEGLVDRLGKRVIRQFVMEHYVKTNGEELYARMAERHNLDPNAMDKNAFMERMAQSSNQLDTPDLNPESFQAFMDGEADKFAIDFALDRFEKRFFEADNPKNAFFNAYKKAAAARYPQASPGLISSQLETRVTSQLDMMARAKSDQVMTEAEMETACSDFINAYFDDVDKSLAVITDPAERARIRTSIITLGVRLTSAQLNFVRMFTQGVAQTLESSVNLDNYHLVQESFKTITGVGSLFNTMVPGHWGKATRQAMVDIAFMAGFAAAGEKLNSAGRLTEVIMAPDSPFIDYFESVSKSDPESPDYTYAKALLTVASEQSGYEIEMEDLSFRDVSLFRKREILGHSQPVGYGYSDNEPGLTAVMPQIRAAHRASAEAMLVQHLPNDSIGLQPNAPVAAGFSDDFLDELDFIGCIVNGTCYSGRENLDRFISAFPSIRDALSVSSFLNDGLDSLYSTATDVVSPPKTFANFGWEDTGKPVVRRRAPYRVVSEGNGRYRISKERLEVLIDKIEYDKANDPVGFQGHSEVVLDVNTPAILSSDVDILLFGWER